MCEHLGCYFNHCLFLWAACPFHFTFPVSQCGTSIVVPNAPNHSAVTHFMTPLWISVRSSLDHTHPGIWLLGHRCGRHSSGPKDVYFLIPGTCEYIAWHGRKDSADVIMDLRRWGDKPGFPRWVQCNRRGSYKRKRRDRRVWVREKFEDTVLLALRWRKEPFSQSQGTWWPLEGRKGKKT